MDNKGVISHFHVDWPCQDFTQCSAREQPSGEQEELLPVDRLEQEVLPGERLEQEELLPSKRLEQEEVLPGEHLEQEEVLPG